MKMISGYLGPDLKVEGDVESKESIRIDGEYKGNINSQREVTIGPSGDVEGEIHAPIIRVSGSVKGSLHASRLLELLGEARVQGDLNTQGIQITLYSRLCLLYTSPSPRD